MARLRAMATVVLVTLLVGGVRAAPETPLLPAGAYAVEHRLELPHVERWAVTRTATICLPDAARAAGLPLPVLSANHPFAGCPARNVRRRGDGLSFDIVCPARGSARAQAVYRLAPDGFAGRIAMVMGGKNMTMTEVQVGRRAGPCRPAGAPQS